MNIKKSDTVNPELSSKFHSLLLQSWRPTLKEIQKQKAIPIDVRLRREGIYYYEEIIHLQPKEWLIKEFGPGQDYPVNISRLMKNIIWQIRTRIIQKQQPPVKGLIRSFWYAYIKPVLSRTNSLNQKVDQYPQMIQMFARLVQYLDLMRYKDIGFTDDNQSDRKIGINNHIILFAEKAGHYPLLQQIAENSEVTIISLGGQPSILSAEYFVDKMKAQGIDIRKSFYTFSLVDYDPSGWIIKNAFLNDLNFFGLKHIKRTDLILLKMFSKEEIESSKYLVPDPKEMKIKNRNWLKESGGINGELYGLEADAAPLERIEQLFNSYIQNLIESTEDIRKGRALFSVAQSLDEYVLARLRTQEK
ncbi:MAG: hypothetical protein ABH873_02320 [Candidatus Firestonebacteria bacterium]